MAKQQMSLKQLAINKDNSAIVIVVGLASFLIVFSLVASNALLKQRSYQTRVITQKEAARDQLKTNVQEAQKLQAAYESFTKPEVNVLGGNSSGGGERDGENSRLVLDALPSKYDFPALATSLDKILKQYNINSITGTDDELAQAAIAATESPQPVEIPFSVTLKGTMDSAKGSLQTLEKSIRPIQVRKIDLTAEANSVGLSVDAKTYFQPQKTFGVKTEKVQ